MALTSAAEGIAGVGLPAPDFEAPNQDGETVRLSDLRGQSVVLYFYPKADTPGCTKQACGIRDRSSEYEGLGAVVLGISPDPPKRLRRFASKYGLPFTLLSDPDHGIARAYGAAKRGSTLGRARSTTQRSSFVIAPDGLVRHVFPNVSPTEHDEIVLGALVAASPVR